MRWIRSPSWDGFWILSGLPLAIAFRFLTINNLISFSIVSIYVLVLLQMAHSLSPYVMAWTHREYRREMLKAKRKYIGIPLMVMVTALVFGVISEAYFPGVKFFDDITDKFSINSMYAAGAFHSPAWWLIGIYILWNTYHFGMQNFGVMSIYRRLSGVSFPDNQRRIDMIVCLVPSIYVFLQVYLFPQGVWYHRCLEFAALVVAMVYVLLLQREAAITGRWLTPRSIFALAQTTGLMISGSWSLAIFAVNHWLVAIGLTSHVSGKNRSPLFFVAGLLVAGVSIFWLMFGKSGAAFSWNLREMLQITTFMACVRTGTGIVHFLYDRWVWQLSNPDVQRTIGRDLLREAPHLRLVA